MSHPDPMHRLGPALAGELPQVMLQTAHEGSLLHDVLAVMTGLLADRARVIDATAQRFDPATAPEASLPWLAGWYGFDWLFTDPQDPRATLPMAQAFPPGVDRLRALLMAWPQIQARRGSVDGLCALLRRATGLDTIAVTHDPVRQALTVHAPGLPTEHQVWFARLVAAERPAHLTWSLTLSPQRGQA